MRKTCSIGTVVFLGLLGSTFMLPASADELVMPPVTEMPPHPVILPHRGQSQGTVLQEFGEPAQRHAAVGGGTPKHTPTTRWEYAGHSVFFERTTVVAAVLKGDPPPTSHHNELQERKSTV